LKAFLRKKYVPHLKLCRVSRNVFKIHQSKPNNLEETREEFDKKYAH
jgi:hypothetical protein